MQGKVRKGGTSKRDYSLPFRYIYAWSIGINRYSLVSVYICMVSGMSVTIEVRLSCIDVWYW